MNAYELGYSAMVKQAAGPNVTIDQAANKILRRSMAMRGAGAGASLGAAIGGGVGALSGAVAPGYDEEGKRRSRFKQMLSKGLLGAALGGAATAAVGGATGYQAAKSMEPTLKRIREFHSLPPGLPRPDGFRV